MPTVITFTKYIITTAVLQYGHFYIYFLVIFITILLLICIADTCTYELLKLLLSSATVNKCVNATEKRPDVHRRLEGCVQIASKNT